MKERVCVSCGFCRGGVSAEFRFRSTGKNYFLCGECFAIGFKKYVDGGIVAFMQVDGWEKNRDRQAKLLLVALFDALKEIE